jgi:very-short-patch-repair endonuclease
MYEDRRAVSRSELIEGGLTRGRLDAMVKSGRLERLHRSLYLPTGILLPPGMSRESDLHPDLRPGLRRELEPESPATFEMHHLLEPKTEATDEIDRARAIAHLAACGPGAVLSHHSAAALYRFDSTKPRPTAIHISARRTCGVRSAPGLAISRPRQLPEFTIIDGLPTTTRAQTVLDLAAIVSPIELRRIVESALRGADPRRPADWRTDVLVDLIRLTTAHPHHRGTGAVLRILAVRPPDARPTGSLPETALLQVLEQHGIEVITQPTLTVHVSDREFHTYFPDQMIVAGQSLTEVDGGGHLEAQRAYSDAIRQNRLVGFHLFRFPANRVMHRTDEVVAELRRHIAMTPPLGNSWSVAGRVVSGSGNEWTVRNHPSSD